MPDDIPIASPLPPASSPATSRPPATTPLPTSARHQEDSHAANSERDRAQNFTSNTKRFEEVGL
ncbi:hypothetical protein Pst134EA_031441 [Puccinia striiformis f. sp. tritici]|uniref:uncharacterized protein n=1 Tax=Puccinia striiformis f. sp. tritici TaxID=168172 RepID=UPI0020072E11|nr:uncharacterized protein Pst134EA_031441 [Puccinia striiformis f. sp. tritici]KAH9440769.1 hypothetical protein Pst134EA_031441 [Puccinia striiformis f. sp. tritici]